jgi:ABC-2 type transport system permease protein
MFLSTAAKYIKLTFHITKTSILSAMEFRASFLTQVVGMIVNDIALVSLWLIFFKRFPAVNGWTLDDTKLVFAITTTNFAIVFILGRGAFDLARSIHQGELDHYLAYPMNVLWHVAVSKTEISAIGDLFFGIAIFVLMGHPTFERTVMYVVFSVLSAGIMYNFIVISQTIGFFFRNFEEAAQDMFHALLGFTFYPQTVFNGALKVIMLTVLPAFFIASIPVQMIKAFSWDLALSAFGFWVLTLWIAVSFFNHGLKKYESGNLIGVKM